MKSYSTRFYTLITLAIIFLLVITTTAAFAGGLILAPQLAGTAQAASITSSGDNATQPLALPDSDEAILAAYENALSSLYDTAVPSVVKIDVTLESRGASGSENTPEDMPFPFGPPDGFPQGGEGSGFVWDKEGHIITNFHVVQDADYIEVIFADGTDIEAEVVGTDPDLDLAVIKVDLPASQLHPMSIGDSDALRVGQLTLAIGAPFGQDFTMTSGIVSAIGRFIPSGNSFFSIPEAIQTDAPINPGNSGGPLLNRHGEVIGINTQILSRSGASSGVGFAVPINMVKRVVPTLISGQAYEYAWLGISGNDLDDEVVTLMNLPADTRGALIIGVAEDGPAEKAGLNGSNERDFVEGRPFVFGGDVIIAINGQPIAGINDVILYLVKETHPGDDITLDVIHASGETEQVIVTLGSRPRN